MNKTLIAKESNRTIVKTHPLWMRLNTMFHGKKSEHPSVNRPGSYLSMVEISGGAESNIASEYAQIAARRMLK